MNKEDITYYKGESGSIFSDDYKIESVFLEKGMHIPEIFNNLSIPLALSSYNNPLNYSNELASNFKTTDHDVENELFNKLYNLSIINNKPKKQTKRRRRNKNKNTKKR